MLYLLKELQTLVISGHAPIPADGYSQTISSIFKRREKFKQVELLLDPENYQTYRWKAGSLISLHLTPPGPGGGSSMVARLNAVQWRDCNASCKIILECLHSKAMFIRESKLKRKYIGSSME